MTRYNDCKITCSEIHDCSVIEDTIHNYEDNRPHLNVDLLELCSSSGNIKAQILRPCCFPLSITAFRTDVEYHTEPQPSAAAAAAIWHCVKTWPLYLKSTTNSN